MEIKIGRSAHGCMKCECEFVHEQVLHCLVRLGEDHLLLREDYCDACWEPGLAQNTYSTWSSHFYDPKVAEQEPPEVFSPLRKLFYDATESEDRAEGAKAFLAAELLRRQKVFRRIKASDGQDGEAQVTLFADRIGNRLIEVTDPSFTHGELEHARTVLMEQLRELEEPETAGETTEDAECEEQ